MDHIPTSAMPSSGKLEEYSSRDPSNHDALFLERLEAFMDKSLADIKAFAERESRPFEETRRCVAEWHAKHLFQVLPPRSTDTNGVSRHDYVRSVLVQTSRVLESLTAAVGMQSFFLAIDLRDDTDPGFLGGSSNGREFWRRLRGGGDTGAKAFKQFCHNSNPSHAETENGPELTSAIVAPAPSASKKNSQTVKAELYDSVRRALQATSGVRNAEMKWSNPERLDVYGVRLVGWPAGVPANNPSTLRANQNKQLLEAFQSGVAHFERLPNSIHPPPIPKVEPQNDPSEDLDDFSWAYDPDASPTTSQPKPKPSASAMPQDAEAGSSSPKAPTRLGSTSRDPTPLSQIGSSLEPWEMYNPVLTEGGEIWDDGGRRSRKRPRSEDPHALDLDLDA